jgi:hypothetical protein
MPASGTTASERFGRSMLLRWTVRGGAPGPSSWRRMSSSTRASAVAVRASTRSAGWRSRRACDEVEDLAVGGAEVVAPGGDAVGLVDHEERDRQPGDRLEALDVVEVLG